MDGTVPAEVALLYAALWENIRPRPITESRGDLTPEWWADRYAAGVRWLRAQWESTAPPDLTALARDYRAHMMSDADSDERGTFAPYALGKGRLSQLQSPLRFPPSFTMRVKSLVGLGWPHDPTVGDQEPYGVVRVTDNPDADYNGWYAAAAHGRQVRLLSIEPYTSFERAIAGAREIMRIEHASAGLVDAEGNRVQRPAAAIEQMVRIGPDWRGGRDVTTREIMDTFGFRGIEFGRWLPQGERQSLLNITYDSMCDLTDLLGVPRRFVSIGGVCGLAFGSRGRGRNSGAAHFERDTWVYHFTRTDPKGSFAHEMAHAFDAALFVRNYDPGVAWPRNRAEPASEDYPEIEFLSQVMALDMEVSRYTTASDTVFAGFPARHPANLWLFRDVMECLYDTRSSASYFRRALRLDGAQSPYWSTPPEMFARAFEAFVVSWMRNAGLRNDFLVSNALVDGAPDRVQGINPYPDDEEQMLINSLLDRFMAQVVVATHLMERERSGR